MNEIVKISPYTYPILKHQFLCKKKYPYVRGYATLTKAEVVNTIAEEFGISNDFAECRTRRRDFSEPRKLLCHIMVFEMGMKKVHAAREIHGYDHSVVIYACKTFRDLYKVDEHYRGKCDRVLKKFNLKA